MPCVLFLGVVASAPNREDNAGPLLAMGLLSQCPLNDTDCVDIGLNSKFKPPRRVGWRPVNAPLGGALRGGRRPIEARKNVPALGTFGLWKSEARGGTAGVCLGDIPMIFCRSIKSFLSGLVHSGHMSDPRGAFEGTEQVSRREVR